MPDWFYGAEAEPRGPVSAEEVRRLLASGELTADTTVWCPADNVGPAPLKATSLGAAAPASPPPPWHYERAGTRVGPVEEGEMRRLLDAGEITRDTLVWSPGLGASFVRLGETTLSPAMTQPPALPASAVDDTLPWVLAAAPLGIALLDQVAGQSGKSIWSWPVLGFLVCSALCLVDERRLIRSGVANKAMGLRYWLWLVPCYLFQRAKALKGPKFYVWAWVASFVASLFVGSDNIIPLLKGDTYWGTGVPACDSAYETRQVRTVFDGMSQVKAAGLRSIDLTDARELGNADTLRTCAAQISVSNAETYRVVYTVETRDDLISTRIQIKE